MTELGLWDLPITSEFMATAMAQTHRRLALDYCSPNPVLSQFLHGDDRAAAPVR